MCECPYESLDDTEHQWKLKNMQKTSESMYRLASKALHENCKIKHGKKKTIEAWE